MHFPQLSRREGLDCPTAAAGMRSEAWPIKSCWAIACHVPVTPISTS